MSQTPWALGDGTIGVTEPGLSVCPNHWNQISAIQLILPNLGN